MRADARRGGESGSTPTIERCSFRVEGAMAASLLLCDRLKERCERRSCAGRRLVLVLSGRLGSRLLRLTPRPLPAIAFSHPRGWAQVEDCRRPLATPRRRRGGRSAAAPAVSGGSAGRREQRHPRLLRPAVAGRVARGDHGGHLEPAAARRASTARPSTACRPNERVVLPDTVSVLRAIHLPRSLSFTVTLHRTSACGHVTRTTAMPRLETRTVRLTRTFGAVSVRRGCRRSACRGCRRRRDAERACGGADVSLASVACTTTV